MTATILSLPASLSRTLGDNVIAVASGKGGVGKTWFSVTLAHAFARTGLRPLLFDGDLGLANVDIQLGLMPERDLSTVIAGHASLRGVVTPVAETGFDVIAGQSGVGSLATLGRERLEALGDDLTALAADYDKVVLDLGAGIEHTVRALARRARLCLVLATDEPTALTDAYAFIKLMAQERGGPELRVVVNQARSRVAGERTYATLLKACENFLRLAPPLAGIVRHDRRVRDSIRLQAPLFHRFPQSDAAADVELIARRLIGTG
jgi:flagellar biosynthesis protein FlhG